MKRSYAVVDIESTGPKFDEGDRMFQFGCAIIENGKIVEEVEWLINPETTISKHVEELTGCTNQMVKNAPYFEEVAPMIAQLLADKVMIAHNVTFDYPFLVKSLESVGISYEAECIDTVQLAQICLPTVDSYRLSDLTQNLGIPHEAAHSAGSDATATAHLFLKLLDLLREIPLLTLRQMRSFAPYLIEQTAIAFEEVWKERKKEKTDPWKVPFVHGIAVNPAVFEKEEIQLPDVQQKDVKNLYHSLVQQQSIVYRSEQERLLLELDKQFQSSNRYQFIEAPAGMGKTLAYLLAAIAHANPERPIWIATATLLLQQQLVEQELEPLLAKLQLNLPYVTIKGKQHYISIHRFSKFIKQPDLYATQRGALTMMGLCMWLTQTTTGDITECNQALYYKEIWDQITVHDAKEKGFDFYQRQKEAAKQSPIVITNHAYLIRELQSLPQESPKKPIVIVDEVQQFESMLESQSTQSLDFTELGTLQQEWNDYHLDHFVDFSSQSEFVSRKMNRNWLKLMDLLEDWQEEVKRQTSSESPLLYSVEEWRKSEHFRILYMVRKSCLTLLKLVHEFRENPVLSYQTSQVLQKIVQQSSAFAKIAQGYVFLSCSTQKQGGVIVNVIHPALQEWNAIQSRWHQFVGLTATLPTFSPLFYHVLPMSEVVTIAQEDHELHHSILIPTDLLTPEVTVTNEWADQVAMVLKKIDTVTNGRMLVLLHSVEMLEALEERLSDYCSLQEIPLFIQRTNQSSRKIQRKFQQEDHVWLLGVYSFWEGFDSGGVSIDALVIPRLPFANPTTVSQQIVKKEIQSQQRNYFDDYALPKMLQQLHQGMGRLNRIYQEPSTIWLLDNRAIRSRYAKDVQQSFPIGAKVIGKTVKKLLNIVKITKRQKENH